MAKEGDVLVFTAVHLEGFAEERTAYRDNFFVTVGA
jgi:hypothetical protein